MDTIVYISELNTIDKLSPYILKNNLGLEIVTYAGSRALDNPQPYLKEREEDFERNGINPRIAFHGPYIDLSPGSEDIRIAKVTKERFLQGYNLAKKYNADRITYHSGYIPRTYWKEQWIESSINFWKDFLEELDGVMEVHMENGFDEDYGLIKEIIDGVNSPYFSICLDIGHANACSSVPVLQWIRELGPRIKHVHAHNNYGKKDNHNGFNHGNMDMKIILENLLEKCNNPSITLEVFKEEELKDSISFLKNLKII